MNYQFNRNFYKGFDFYIWLVLVVWSALDFRGHQSTFEYWIDIIFIVISILGVLSTLFKKVK